MPLSLYVLGSSKKVKAKDPTPIPPSSNKISSPTPTSSIIRSTPVPTLTSTPTTNPMPPSEKTITSTVNFGVVVDDYANRSGGISNVEQMIDYSISTVSIFKQFGSRYNSTLILDDLAYIKSQNKKLLLAWEPWNPEQGGNQSIDYLREIPEGKHDPYIRSFASSLKSYGSPITLRFGHEMNGNWYPWGNRAADYIKAYRYIVTFFRNEGVSNVKWMWSINAENVPLSPIENVSSFYPGDDVVDIVGLDGFNFGSTSSSGWRSFKSIFYPSYIYLSSKYSKPLIISEMSSSEVGGDKASWVKSMFADLPATFSKINDIVWFNLIKETDWRVNSSTASLDAFKVSFP